MKLQSENSKGETKDSIATVEPDIAIVNIFDGITSNQENIKFFEGIACGPKRMLKPSRISLATADKSLKFKKMPLH